MKKISLYVILFALSACSAVDVSTFAASDAKVADVTKTDMLLRSLPAPKQKVPVSVYDFQDQTGQHKPDDNFAQYSRAVTQGGLSMLVKALVDASDGKWFTVIERNGLQNLLQERNIIRNTRNQYRMPDGSKLPELPPLLYAGMLIEGGVISYESNVLTGGIGARYLGIGGKTDYRQDIVTVYLRAVSVQTGEVLLSVNTSKTIYSAGINGNVYRYTAVNDILELESGFTTNEPPQFAVRQAIEMGVYAMIMEGNLKGLWDFGNATAGKLAVDDYVKRRDSNRAASEQQVWAQTHRDVNQPAPAPETMSRGQTPAESISAPTGSLQPVVPQKEVQEPTLVAPAETPATEPLQPKDKLYCGNGGCYPFVPPAGSTTNPNPPTNPTH